MTGHHPINHGKTSPSTDDDWINYWVAYYRRSRQLKKAGPKSWNATKEVWERKLVQAKRIRCQQCTRIVKLWLKTFGYGPEKYMLKENISERGKTKEFSVSSRRTNTGRH